MRVPRIVIDIKRILLRGDTQHGSERIITIASIFHTSRNPLVNTKNKFKLHPVFLPSRVSIHFTGDVFAISIYK